MAIDPTPGAGSGPPRWISFLRTHWRRQRPPAGVPFEPPAPADEALIAAIAASYDELRSDSREALAELPPLLHRLGTDSRRLRDELQGLTTIRRLAQPPQQSDLDAAISEAGRRYRAVVAALRRIRTALVRLEGRAWNRRSLDTDLADAHEIAAQIERMAAAGLEFDSLNFPPT